MSARHFQYAVFLSHNRAQKDWTRELARRLRDDGFKVWFDEWVLPQHAGRNWITELRQGVEDSSTLPNIPICVYQRPSAAHLFWRRLTASRNPESKTRDLKDRKVNILFGRGDRI